jgi:raffinose/stachyose/melibiose transport system permease protein
MNATDASGQPRRRRRDGTPWLFAIPALLLILAFHYVAPLLSLGYAFTDWDGVGTPTWIGLANFTDIAHSSRASGAIVNTFKLAGAFFVLVNVVGLGLALALHRTLKSRLLLRSLFFIPVAMSPLATAYIWQYIFTYDGALNQFLNWVGLDSWVRVWLGDPTWALWTILVVLVWQYSGLAMVIYLAGLETIPAEIHEASALDGGSAWFRFRKITFPLLAPSLVVSATLSLVLGLRVFDQVLALTGGGPVLASETLALEVWLQTFVYGRFGYGAALAVVLAGIVAAVVLTQLWFFRAREARA